MEKNRCQQGNREGEVLYDVNRVMRKDLGEKVTSEWRPKVRGSGLFLSFSRGRLLLISQRIGLPLISLGKGSLFCPCQGEKHFPMSPQPSTSPVKIDNTFHDITCWTVFSPCYSERSEKTSCPIQHYNPSTQHSAEKTLSYWSSEHLDPYPGSTTYLICVFRQVA